MESDWSATSGRTGGAAAPGHTTEEIKKAVASVMEKQKLYFGVVKSNNPSSKVNYEIVSESFGVRDIKVISGLLGGGNTDKKIIGQVFIDKKWRDVKESDWPNWAYQIGDEPRLTFSNKANFVWLEKQENGVAVKFASDEIKEAFENLYKDWHAGKINLLRGVSANHFSWDEIVRDGIIRSDGPNDSPRATMSTEKTTAPKPKNPKKIMDTEAPEGRFWAEDGTRWLPTDVDTPKNREVVEGIAKGNLADYTGEVKNALINNSPDILAGMVLNIEAGKDSKLNICMITAGEIVVQGPIKKNTGILWNRKQNFKIDTLINGAGEKFDATFFDGELPNSAPYATEGADEPKRKLADVFIEKSKDTLEKLRMNVHVLVVEDDYFSQQSSSITAWKKKFKNRFVLVENEGNLNTEDGKYIEKLVENKELKGKKLKISFLKSNRGSPTEFNNRIRDLKSLFKDFKPLDLDFDLKPLDLSKGGADTIYNLIGRFKGTPGSPESTAEKFAQALLKDNSAILRGEAGKPIEITKLNEALVFAQHEYEDKDFFILLKTLENEFLTFASSNREDIQNVFSNARRARETSRTLSDLIDHLERGAAGHKPSSPHITQAKA